MLSGVHFKKALFVPNTSVYYKVGTALPVSDAQVDLSWQTTLQKIWEGLVAGEKGKVASWVYSQSVDTLDLITDIFLRSWCLAKSLTQFSVTLELWIMGWIAYKPIEHDFFQ